MFDLTTVGHFAIDLISSPTIVSPKPTLGGAPTYVSLTARKLGAQVSVISKVGEDFPQKYWIWLKSQGVDLSGLKLVKGSLSTKFVLEYGNGERKLALTSRAPIICPEDVSIKLRAKAIHTAPITNEIPLEVIEKLRTLTNILSLDPQGFLRRFDDNGRVCSKKWDYKNILDKIDVYKSSLGEIETATGTSELPSAMRKIHDQGVKIVIVTNGAKGATLSFDGKIHNIPACKPRINLDPTGAGDAFIGAFLAEFVREKDPEWCACVGSAASSFVVEGIGPAVFGEKEEVYYRARQIYGKELK